MEISNIILKKKENTWNDLFGVDERTKYLYQPNLISQKAIKVCKPFLVITCNFILYTHTHTHSKLFKPILSTNLIFFCLTCIVKVKSMVYSSFNKGALFNNYIYICIHKKALQYFQESLRYSSEVCA